MTCSTLLLLSSFALARPGLDVGVGVRQVSSTYDQWPVGLHALGRVALTPRFALELSGAVRLPTDEANALATRVIVATYEANSAYPLRLPIERELGAVTLLAQGSPWRRQLREGLSAWPYGAAGIETRFTRTDHARVSDGYAASVEGVAVAAGLGFDLWFGQRLGARILWLERLTPGEELSSAVAIDLLVAF